MFGLFKKKKESSHNPFVKAYEYEHHPKEVNPVNPCDDYFTAECATNLFQEHLVSLEEAMEEIKIQAKKGKNGVTFYKNVISYDNKNPTHGRLLSEKCKEELKNRGFEIESYRGVSSWDEITWKVK